MRAGAFLSTGAPRCRVQNGGTALKYYGVMNTRTREMLECVTGPDCTRLDEYELCSHMVRQMNLEHRGGSAHVLDAHDGQAQVYTVVSLDTVKN